MCEHCDSTAGRVARELGMDTDVVLRVMNEWADERRRESEAEEVEMVALAGETAQALTEMMGLSVRPALLGVEPFVLITVEDVEQVGNSIRHTLGIEMGGGIHPGMVSTVLRDALESYELRGEAGVLSSGALVEPTTSESGA